MLPLNADTPLLASNRSSWRRISVRATIFIVTVAIVTKAFILQNLLWPYPVSSPSDEFYSLFNVGAIQHNQGIVLKEVDVEEDAKRAWAYNRFDTRYGSSFGGGGMPVAAAGVYPFNDSAAEELKRQQFEKVMDQFEKDESTGQDFVINASTGRPVPLTEEQKTRLKRIRAKKKANEQSIIDSIAFAWEDNYIPTKYIYPDGEDTGPKAYDGVNLPNLAPHLSDRHVSANGKVTEHEGDVFGVFRQGVFGPAKPAIFNNFGESFGFGDRPLRIRDVNYKRQAELRRATLEYYARRNRAQNTTCSGHGCTDAWGKVGVGDQVIDSRTGETVPGHENVGPNSMVMTPDRRMGMDRQVDPQTGEELPGCIGPQCEGFRLDLGPAPDLDSTGGASGPGVQADSNNPGAEGPDKWDRYSAPAPGTSAYGNSVPPEKGYYSNGDSKVTWEPHRKQWGSWIKNWNAGSWLAFVLIGPILTCGVSTFVFLVRGPVWGLSVFVAMIVLDLLIFYFG